MLKDIYHFLKLGDDLLTAGMPTAEQLGDVARAGVKTVINLAIPGSERALPNEAAIVQSLGMQYIGIPVLWDHPTRSDLDQFMDTMDGHRQEKLFVHCQANYRVTGFVALYRILRLGWDREAALADLRRVWNPQDYPVWNKFIEGNLPPRG